MHEVLGMIASMLMNIYMVGLFSTVHEQGQNRVIYAAAASQFQSLLDGTKAYVDANSAQLLSAVPVGSITQLGLPALIAANDLPPNFTATNPFGQYWQIFLTQPQAGQIEAYVESAGGTQLGLPALTSVVGMAGGQSGFVPPDGVMASLNSGTAIGNMGKWRLPLSGLPNPGSGHFYGIATASASAQYNSDTLYRDNVPGHPELNRMNATLNMGGNNIANGAAAQFSGRIGSLGVDANTLPPGWGGGLATLDVAAQGSIGAGPAGQNPRSWINSSGNGHVDQNFSVGNQLTANSVQLPQGNSLQVGSASMYGDGSNAAIRAPNQVFIQHPDGSLAPLIAGSLNLPNGNNINEGTASYYGDNDNAAVRTPGQFYVQHPDGSLAPVSASTVSATTGVQYSGTAALGASCGQPGLTTGRNDGSGEILSCTRGIWQSLTFKQFYSYLPPTTTGFAGYASVNPATGNYSCQAGTADTYGATFWYGDYGYSTLHICQPR